MNFYLVFFVVHVSICIYAVAGRTAMQTKLPWTLSLVARVSFEINKARDSASRIYENTWRARRLHFPYFSCLI